jgi:hypothetical protein
MSQIEYLMSVLAAGQVIPNVLKYTLVVVGVKD